MGLTGLEPKIRPCKKELKPIMRTDLKLRVSDLMKIFW